MATFTVWVNPLWPGADSKNIAECSTRNEAVEILEKWLEQSYPGRWEKYSGNDTQWSEKDSRGGAIAMGGIDVRYTVLEERQREFKALVERESRLMKELADVRYEMQLVIAFFAAIANAARDTDGGERA